MPDGPQQQPSDPRLEIQKRLRELLASKGIDPHSVSSRPNPGFTEEKRDLEHEQKKAHLHGLIQDIEERKKYAKRTFILVVCWLISILAIIVLQGFSAFGLKLDAGIVEATIGGTTTGVIGLFLIVTRYLFPRR